MDCKLKQSGSDDQGLVLHGFSVSITHTDSLNRLLSPTPNVKTFERLSLGGRRCKGKSQWMKEKPFFFPITFRVWGTTWKSGFEIKRKSVSLFIFCHSQKHVVLFKAIKWWSILLCDCTQSRLIVFFFLWVHAWVGLASACFVVVDDFTLKGLKITKQIWFINISIFWRRNAGQQIELLKFFEEKTDHILQKSGAERYFL